MTMLTGFSPDELRVLGVMIEKALTTPDQYPMTVNAVTLGCNQKQNRDPVMELSEADASRAVRQLELRGAVEQAPPSPGARAVRFRHRVTEVFRWDRREMAIMAELMLRGPQTAGELRTRASRMTPFQDVQSVVNILEGLANGETPAARMMPKEPGRSAHRYRHLLGGQEGEPAVGVAPGTDPSAGPGGRTEAKAVQPAGGAALTAASAGEWAALVERIGHLEARLAAIEVKLCEREQSRADLELRDSASADAGAE